MASQLEIYNRTLRLLGTAVITQAQLDADSKEQARILNDVYTQIRDEVLEAHPWNFAIARATLSSLGGLVETWTDNGSNVWYATLTTEPASVRFDGTEGTEKTSVAACTSARDWFWESNVLYVYSTSDPDDAYGSPGVFAVIPEFRYDYAYGLPSGCLRVIRMEDDDSKFVIEGTRLLTNDSECKIKYISQVTTTTNFSTRFVGALAYRLAAEVAYPITNSTTGSENMTKLYLNKLREAKAVDAQEGTGIQMDEETWISARE